MRSPVRSDNSGFRADPDSFRASDNDPVDLDDIFPVIIGSCIFESFVDAPAFWAGPHKNRQRYVTLNFLEWRQLDKSPKTNTGTCFWTDCYLD